MNKLEFKDRGWRFATRFTSPSGLAVTVKRRTEGTFRLPTGEVQDYLFSIEIGRKSFAENRLVSPIPVLSVKGQPILVCDDICDLIEQAEDWIAAQLSEKPEPPLLVPPRRRTVTLCDARVLVGDSEGEERCRSPLPCPTHGGTP